VVVRSFDSAFGLAQDDGARLGLKMIFLACLLNSTNCGKFKYANSAKNCLLFGRKPARPALDPNSRSSTQPTHAIQLKAVVLLISQKDYMLISTF
jgi:hypothetical protein